MIMDIVISEPLELILVILSSFDAVDLCLSKLELTIR